MKILHDQKRRTLLIISSLSVALVATLVVIATLVVQLVLVGKPLPPIPTHQDVGHRTVETFAQSLSQTFPLDNGNFVNSTCPALTKSGLAAENNLPGVNMTMSDWRDVQFYDPHGSLLWADKNNVNCGDSISIHASTFDNYSYKDSNRPRTIAALRIGWYNGAGAREVWKSKPMIFPHLRIPHAFTNTRLVQTNWPTLLTVNIDQSWTPGFYLLVTYSPSGYIESEDPLVVHNPLGTANLAIMHSFITWQMYNAFGGYSAYIGPGGSATDQRTERSREVSFDRPYYGSGGFAIKRDGLSMMQFLEKNNVLVDNYSDLDMNNFPSIFRHYRGIVISGHAEYMPRRLFDSFIAARNNGINLALFGANDAYWQTRLAPAHKVPDRLAYMYRVATQDPITDWDKITLEYSDPRVNTPSNLITGGLTSGVHVFGDLKLAENPSWLKLPKNAAIQSISPDTEIESSFPTPASPPNIHVLFQGRLNYAITPPGKHVKIPFEQTMWFTTPSGAAVFNSGFTTWACDLVDSCVYPSISGESQKILQDVTLKVLDLWGQPQIGKKLELAK